MIDSHVHSKVSADCNVPMQVMCANALRKGIDMLAFTEHLEFYQDYQNCKFDKEAYIERYFTEIALCREKFRGRLNIFSGMEVGQAYLASENALKTLKEREFDFILGAIHKLDDVDLKNLRYTEETAPLIAKRYYDAVRMLAETGSFDCLAHLDLFKRYSMRKNCGSLYKENKEKIEEILKILIRREKGIELNTSGIRQGIQECMPSFDVMCMYRELGGELVTLGSDAHRPEDIGDSFVLGVELLKKAGFMRLYRYERRKPVVMCYL